VCVAAAPPPLTAVLPRLQAALSINIYTYTYTTQLHCSSLMQYPRHLSQHELQQATQVRTAVALVPSYYYYCPSCPLPPPQTHTPNPLP